MSEEIKITIEDNGNGDYDMRIELPLKGLRGNPVHANVYGIGYVGDEEEEAAYVAYAKQIAALFKSASIRIKRPIFEYVDVDGGEFLGA